jgi:phenol/toluene 2-monooxygenase (NADH) P1/A1
MSVEIKTASIEPLRQTFDHVAARIGEGKPASRYQEAVFDIQPKINFHYRPTWEPELELYDVRRTAIKMEDFDQLLDPRQYYYGAYVIQRSKQQDSQERNFDFVEKRGLLDPIPEEWKDKIRRLVIPLRHLEWGANLNNYYIASYGYGTPITSAASMQGMDRLGNAQYITRLGLALDKNYTGVLENAKEYWMNLDIWQPMRKLVEDSFVEKDWFELHVLQNFLLDGVIHPLAFCRFEQEVTQQGGAAFAMLTEFMEDWYKESSRWTDASLKVAAAESVENKALIESWFAKWLPRVIEAVEPLTREAIGDRADEFIESVTNDLRARASKIKLEL